MKQRVKQVITVLMVLLLGLCYSNFNIDTAFASKEKAQESGSITFHVSGDGTASFTGEDEKEVNLENGTKEITMPEWAYVRIKADAKQETKIKIAVSTKEGIALEETSEVQGTSFTRDITVTNENKVVRIVFGDEELPINQNNPTLYGTARASESQPEVGDVFSGICSIAAVNGGGGHTVRGVTVWNFTGILAGQTVNGGCADHTAAAPYVGQGYTYTYTVTNVNKSTGQVDGNIYATSQTGSTDGVSMDGNGNLLGYQRVNGMTSIHRAYNGYLKLQKTSANQTITNGNPCYSLEGAKYGVYRDQGCTQEVTILTTDASGNSNTVEVAEGQYYVKEKSAPKGYALDSRVYPVHVTSGQTATISVEDEPLNDPAAIEIAKIDQETGSKTTQGAASLEGAQFTVKYYAGFYTKETLPSTATRTWVLETKAVTNPNTKETVYLAMLTERYKVSGGEFYFTGNNPNPVIPLGTITVEETKSPNGYLLEGAYLQAKGGDKVEGIYVSQITQENNAAHLTGGNEYSMSDRVVRGDFEFTKRDEESKEAMAEIPFKITSKTTKESHTFMTDENGYYSSASDYVKHSVNTNKGKIGDGLWFGLDADGKSVEVNDEFGALPYDTYLLEELRCKGNGGKALYKGTLVVSRDGFKMDLGTIENPDVTIETEAIDADTGTHYAVADDQVIITDTVTYTGLKKQEHEIIGIAMDQETNEPVLDKNGEKITAKKIFTPKTAEGTTKVEFSFDASNLRGKAITFFEVLYLNGEKVAEHNDINDEEQTIYFPELKTSVKDIRTETNISMADKKMRVIDTVDYSGAVVNKKQTIKGYVIDFESGKQIKDDEGDPITAKTEITPKQSSGSAEVLFEFDGEKLEGKTLVFAEELYMNGKKIAEHKDINDKAQTIYIPKIGTTAMDQETGTHISMADNRTIIVDTVSYKNLIPGLKYEIKGKVVNQKTGEVVTALTGKQINQTEIPKEAEPMFLKKGKYVYVSEGDVALPTGMYQETDTGYTQYVEPGKKLDTGIPITVENIPEEKAVWTGTAEKSMNIYIWNGQVTVLPDAEYELSSEEQEVLGNQTIIPAEPDGVIDMTFVFDSSNLAGTSLVVEEEIYQNGKQIAVHNDLEDKNQTIYIPKIGTTAIDAETGSHKGTAGPGRVIIDTVTFENLVVDETYIVKGTVMDQKTGKELRDQDGNPITSENTFTAKGINGSVELKFNIDASLLDGKAVVVYEEVYDESDNLVAEHKDIHDESQTVSYEKDAISEIAPKTGLKSQERKYILLAVVCLIFGVLGIILYKKKHIKSEPNNKI